MLTCELQDNIENRRWGGENEEGNRRIRTVVRDSEIAEHYQEELEASEEVREEYEEMLKELSPELCAILDRIEEAWYLMKEAELQATYMQGISDGMDMQKEKLRRVCWVILTVWDSYRNFK